MKTDDLENELRNLKFTHLTEVELIAYSDQQLDQIGRDRVEAHLKRCFICERRLALLLEESAALSRRQTSAEDVALVDRLIEQMESDAGPSTVRTAAKEISLPPRERLAEYLRQMVANWRIYFGQGALRGVPDFGRGARRSVPDPEDEIWRWQSEDGSLVARATIEKNADLTIRFSSNEMDLEGARLNIRLGASSHETTLRRVSESEVNAKVALPWRQRPRNIVDISIEIISPLESE